jgi:hypothetical protein
VADDRDDAGAPLRAHVEPAAGRSGVRAARLRDRSTARTGLRVRDEQQLRLRRCQYVAGVSPLGGRT